MTFNNIIAISMLAFIGLLAISTVFVFAALLKELKKTKTRAKKEEEVN